MTFITILNWKKLVDLIDLAQNNIYLVLPGLDDLLAEYLISKKNEKGISIKVCVDNCEEVIRNGYGDEIGINKLLLSNIYLRESKGNRVSFLITDNQGYLLFPESRIFSADPAGPNAIELDRFTICRLIAHYFPPGDILEKDQLEKRLEDSFEQQKQWLRDVDN